MMKKIEIVIPTMEAYRTVPAFLPVASVPRVAVNEYWKIPVKEGDVCRWSVSIGLENTWTWSDSVPHPGTVCYWRFRDYRYKAEAVRAARRVIEWGRLQELDEAHGTKAEAPIMDELRRLLTPEVPREKEGANER